jgi:hypothetical protein
VLEDFFEITIKYSEKVLMIFVKFFHFPNTKKNFVTFLEISEKIQRKSGTPRSMMDFTTLRQLPENNGY